MNKKTIVIVLLVSIYLASCAPAARTNPVGTTVPNPIFTPIPLTPTICPYMRNPGPPPPEVEKRAHDAFCAMGVRGIRGTLKVEANGEYSCDHFAVEDINFEYTLYVSDLENKTTIKEYVSKVTESAKESLQGWNMGYVKVRFVAGEECWWDELQNACAPIRPLTNP
jgi:hypothetical protein